MRCLPTSRRPSSVCCPSRSHFSLKPSKIERPTGFRFVPISMTLNHHVHVAWYIMKCLSPVPLIAGDTLFLLLRELLIFVIFAARCYPSAAYAVMRCVCVCLCVCLFVCLSRLYILSKRINVSSKFFSSSGSHTILVFPHQTAWQYSDGKPLTGGRMQVG